MKRTASVLAVVAIMSAAAYRTSVAMPIAPLTGAQTQSNNITQIYWYHHRWYPNQYWRRPYLSWGGYPSRYYWDPRPYWSGSRWGWWWR